MTENFTYTSGSSDGWIFSRHNSHEGKNEEKSFPLIEGIWIMVVKCTEPQTMIIAESLDKLNEFLNIINEGDVDIYYVPPRRQNEILKLSPIKEFVKRDI